jgi:tetratricopeptide (TPR) repeat protein
VYCGGGNVGSAKLPTVAAMTSGLKNTVRTPRTADSRRVNRTHSIPARRGIGIYLVIAVLATVATVASAACNEDSLEPTRQRPRERADIAILVGEGNAAAATDQWGPARDAYQKTLRLDEKDEAVRALADRATTYATDRETLREIERAAGRGLPEDRVVFLVESIGADSPFKEPARKALARFREIRLSEEAHRLAATMFEATTEAPGPKTPAPPPKAGLSVEALVTQSETLVRAQQYEPALRHCEGALRKDDRNIRAATACAIAACNLRDLKKARDFLKRLGASTERLNAARQICLRASLQVRVGARRRGSRCRRRRPSASRRAAPSISAWCPDAGFA